MPFCTSCGHQNADTARFCNRCGQQMPIATPSAPQSTPNPSSQPPPTSTPSTPRQTRVFQPVQQQTGGSGMGIAGMILGIIGVVFAFVPLVGPFIAIPCIVVGLLLSIVGFVRNQRRNQGKGMATAGIICNIVALLMVIIAVAITAAAVNEIDEALSEASTTSTTRTTSSRSSTSISTARPTSRPSSTSTSTNPRSTSGPSVSEGNPAPTVAPSYFKGDGSYEVGVDIEPGKYRTAGPAKVEWGPCIFARLRTAGASLTQLDEVLDVQQLSGWATVTILESDGGFFTQNCHEWIPASGPQASIVTPTVPGVPTPTVIPVSTTLPAATERPVVPAVPAEGSREDAPTPTPVRLPLGQFNPPTAQQHAEEQAEKRWLAQVGATPVPTQAIPMEPGQRRREDKPPTSTFTDGYWGVGTDIFPGEYSTMGPPIGRKTEYPCTFARLRTVESKIDAPGEIVEIVDIWLPPKSTVVTIEPTDRAVYSSNCQRWRRLGSLTPDQQATIEAHEKMIPVSFDGSTGTYSVGKWLLGYAIAPGLYRTEGPEYTDLGDGLCVFALMSKAYASPQGDRDAVIEIYGADGPATVRIDSKGFYTYNCQEWTPVK